MKSPNRFKRRTVGAIMALCLVVTPGMVVTMTALPGCDAGAGFLGLQDYQRDLLFGFGALALQLLGVTDDGPVDPTPGQDITPGCTIEDNGDGTSTVTCIQVNADGSTTSTAVTVRREAEVASCTVADNGDSTKTIACTDGTEVIVSDGENGTDGQDGTDGTSCSVADNGDGTVTISCTDGTSATVKDGERGPRGPAGQDGESCTIEEVDDEVIITCGENSVVIKKYYNTVPLFGNLFIDQFFTFNTPRGIPAPANEDGLEIINVIEPALGACGTDRVAYKMAVPERYDFDGLGNPITMRIYLYRTGIVDGCAVLRLDAFLARHGGSIYSYGESRYIKLDLSEISPEEEVSGALLVVDLPLNNGPDLTKSLGFSNPQSGDLIAFELNMLDEDILNDGGCYTMLGVDFFESIAGDAQVAVKHAEVFPDQPQAVASCTSCTFIDPFERPLGGVVGNGWVEAERGPDALLEDGVVMLIDDPNSPVGTNTVALLQPGDNSFGPPNGQTEPMAWMAMEGIDVTAYGDEVTLRYDWAGYGSVIGYFDSVWVEWRECSTNAWPAFPAQDHTPAFFPPEDIGLNRIAYHELKTLTVGVVTAEEHTIALGGATCIDLRFRMVGSTVTDGVLIDNVSLCGEEAILGYACADGGECVLQVNGPYASEAECLEECGEPPVQDLYDCTSNGCEITTNGLGMPLDVCTAQCNVPV